MFCFYILIFSYSLIEITVIFQKILINLTDIFQSITIVIASVAESKELIIGYNKSITLFYVLDVSSWKADR